MSINKYFISGHTNLRWEEFALYYIPLIEKGIQEGAEFYVCDCEGADRMAQRYLVHRNYEKLTLVYMGNDSAYDCRCLTNKHRSIGGFQSDVERDAHCTSITTHDIAWVRQNRWNSGTAHNILRRRTMDYDRSQELSRMCQEDKDKVLDCLEDSDLITDYIILQAQAFL